VAGSVPHAVLTWIVAIVLLACVLLFMALLVAEVYRSYRFACRVHAVKRRSVMAGPGGPSIGPGAWMANPLKATGSASAGVGAVLASSGAAALGAPQAAVTHHPPVPPPRVPPPPPPPPPRSVVAHGTTSMSEAGSVTSVAPAGGHKRTVEGPGEGDATRSARILRVARAKGESSSRQLVRGAASGAPAPPGLLAPPPPPLRPPSTASQIPR
jgi:hypothetical protein